MMHAHERPRPAGTAWGILTRPIGPVFLIGRFANAPAPSAADVLAQADLPGPIKTLIAEVVRRTRLWPREQADVARELAAHFEDALAAGAAPDDAMRAFGDSVRASRLIRRAKRRARGPIWHLWIRGLQTFALLVALVVVLYMSLMVRFHSASPTIARDFVAELSEPALAVPEHQRAWPLYKKAYLQLSALPEGLITRQSPGRFARPGDAEWPAVQRYLQDHREALALTKQAAQRSDFGYALIDAPDVEIYAAGFRRAGLDEKYVQRQTQHLHQPGEPLYFQMFDVHAILILSRMLLADTRDAAEEGDSPRATANLHALIGIAGHQQQIPMTIGDQIAFSLLISASNVLLDLLDRYPELFTDDELRQLAHVFGLFDEGGRLHIDLSGDRAIVMDIIQRVYSDDGRGDGRLTPEGIELLGRFVDSTHADTDSLARMVHRPVMHPLLATRAASRAETIAEANRIFTSIESYRAAPPWEWTEPPEVRLLLHPDHQQWRIRHPVLAITMPASNIAAERAEHARLHRDAATAAIALELHRRRSGSYPESLSALVPLLLPRLPVDPFDGQPIRYRIRDDGRPMLYVLGANRKDDGGTPPPDEVILRERQRAGSDNALINFTLRSLRWQRPLTPVEGDWILWPRSE